ncbi:ExbD/TolR family protein [Rubritalea tangerina]|uniref:ExbD/TolR family protein n=1 Tax=Rubritalea tangerina TaxID=430798 RepID=A0ABW4ZB89_9BACT
MKTKPRSLFRGNEEEHPVDVSSLIDVCFLLLIFFLVTATIMPRESDLDMQLPSPGVSAPVDDLVLRICVGADDSISIVQDSGGSDVLETDGGVRILPVLEERIEMMQMAASPNKLLVQIDVEDDASHQRFIDVMNCLSEKEVEQISLVTRGES